MNVINFENEFRMKEHSRTRNLRTNQESMLRWKKKRETTIFRRCLRVNL
jgi:hypothetical protein